MKRWLILGLACVTITSNLSAQTETDGDIVVIGRKVGQVSITLGRDAAGRTTCGLNRSSGDGRIDSAVCKRASKCVTRKPISPAAMDVCISKHKRALIKAWAKGQRS